MQINKLLKGCEWEKCTIEENFGCKSLHQLYEAKQKVNLHSLEIYKKSREIEIGLYLSNAF